VCEGWGSRAREAQALAVKIRQGARREHHLSPPAPRLHFSSAAVPFTGSYHPAPRDMGTVQVEPTGLCSGCHQGFLTLPLNLGIVVLQQEEKDM